MKIKGVKAKKIKDSRGAFTIEVSVNGCKASAPSGKSTGKYETPCYRRSLDWNIKAINSLKLRSEVNSFQDLKKIEALIKKEFKLKDVKQFGANALIALEIAVLRALAKSQKKQLWQIINPLSKKFPLPVGNAVGGGLHSHNQNAPAVQEFLLIPKSKSPKENFNNLKQFHKKIKKHLGAKTKNDEGAWQTDYNTEQILEFISKLNICLGIDVAASAFYKKKEYYYKNKCLNRISQIHYINSLIKKYNLLYIEDPLEEEDFKGFAKVKHSSKNLVVGDDLTATQISRVKRAIKLNSINAMIIKPNQNGSLLEVAEIFKLCKRHRIKTILSHRSGETLDNSLADLAFGFGADYIKAGISTKWREAKLKRLVQIEKIVNSSYRKARVFK